MSDTPDPTQQDYSLPVAKLFDCGDPRELSYQIAYGLEFGLTEEHVPELLQVLYDPKFNQLDSERSAVWAPLHAWRALSELRALEAIEPLLDFMLIADEHEDYWFSEDLPELMVKFGPVALEPLAARLASPDYSDFSRIIYTEALEKLAIASPETRSQCVQILSQQLEPATSQDPGLNGFIIASLVALDATDAVPLIEKAFAADAVDPMVVGDWERVARDLGVQVTPPKSRKSAKSRSGNKAKKAPKGFQSLLKESQSRQKRR